MGFAVRLLAGCSLECTAMEINGTGHGHRNTRHRAQPRKYMVQCMVIEINAAVEEEGGREKNCKMTYGTRNAKDTMVSYFYFKGSTKHSLPQEAGMHTLKHSWQAKETTTFSSGFSCSHLLTAQTSLCLPFSGMGLLV
ncbi:Sulfotransferase 1C4 [Manis javanica]|nr:Sulfotransferase 1C4 [Manis javanica]